MFTFLFKVTTPACNVCEQFKSESCYAASRHGQEQLRLIVHAAVKGLRMRGFTGISVYRDNSSHNTYRNTWDEKPVF